MPKNENVKLIKFWSLHSALWISSQTSKRCNAVIGSIAINVRLMYTDFPENITSKASIIMGRTAMVQKGSEHRHCQTTKESERKNISDRYPIIVQPKEAYPLSRASANVLNCCWTACWTSVGYRSEMLFLSLSFLSFDGAGAPNLFVPLSHGSWWWKVLTYAFWKVFLQESENDGDRTIVSTFYSSVLIHDAECTVRNLINFFTLSFLGMESKVLSWA